MDRATRVDYVVTDLAGFPTGRLRGVTGGSLAFTTANSVHGSGSLSMVDAGEEIDWLTSQIEIEATFQGKRYKLGRWLPSRPARSYTRTGVTWEVTLADITSRLADYGPSGGYAVDAGDNIRAKITEIIINAGVYGIKDLPDTEATVSSPLAFIGEETWLQIANELARGNYFSLAMALDGEIQIVPSVAASDRAVKHSWVDGRGCRYRSELESEQDLWRIPNMVLVISSETGDDPPVTGVYINQDSEDPFSVPNRGRIIRHVETGVEVSTNKAAMDYAKRRWQELSSAQHTVEIEHEFAPHVFLNDVVRFARRNVAKEHRIDGRFVIQRQEIDLGSPALLTKTTLKGVG